MRTAFFDTFSGASGDMIVGALLDAGLPLDVLRRELDKLDLSGYELSAERVSRGVIAATQFTVHVHHHAAADGGHHHPHRNLRDITTLIEAADLSDSVKSRARRVFVRLAEAEAAVHGTTIDEVHFHEVGAVDSIVDIVGAAVGLDELGIGRVVSGPLRFGSGTVQCRHGLLPLPAPATVRLAEGFPTEHTGIEGELTTPTGAAILTALAERFGTPPPMRLDGSGFGAGSADRAERPNVLRLLVGTECGGPAADRVAVLEANIDDTSAEIIAHTAEALFEAGALDVFTVPIQMKKSRPGTLLSVIARPADRAALESIIFRQTTTFGIRRREDARSKLDRRTVEVELDGETVRVKLGLLDGEVITVSPEYEDCARVGRASGRPLRQVYADAVAAAEPA